jgi:cytochrome c peroxidase
MKRIGIPLIVLLPVLFAAFKFQRQEDVQSFKPWPAMVYDFSYETKFKERAALGRYLFYDPILSGDSSISCASCHLQYTAFAHVDHALSHGIYDSVGFRNAPALINLAWHKQLMWDGAIHHLDMQALAPIHNPGEMGSSIQEVVMKINRSDKYKSWFYDAFGDEKATGNTVLIAISRFLSTLVSNQSRYDSVMRHEKVFTAQEKRGYELFKQHCNTCHTEPLFTNLKYEDNGLPMDEKLHDYGRYRITQNRDDSLKFKVPTLRNITHSYPYMHDGRFQTLSEVFAHYDHGMVQRNGVAPGIKKGIKLSSAQRVDLTAFLLTLTDKHFLFNPNLGFPPP